MDGWRDFPTGMLPLLLIILCDFIITLGNFLMRKKYRIKLEKGIVLLRTIL
ncbi:unnamed protein product [Meloidogyne enterolobii]|uniref:Uncharacterized protein n=1 Tax=Meloidogyne enterolobii TaxID=390850 RepID=A0ACB0YNX2_MELEN